MTTRGFTVNRPSQSRIEVWLECGLHSMHNGSLDVVGDTTGGGPVQPIFQISVNNTTTRRFTLQGAINQCADGLARECQAISAIDEFLASDEQADGPTRLVVDKDGNFKRFCG